MAAHDDAAHGRTLATLADDSLGQSLAEELRWYGRFRQARRSSIPWRCPEPEERRAICADPRLGRFADDVAALAEWEGRRWIVMERDWHGWPDPPRYVLFALQGDAIWLAADFDNWPYRWPKPWTPPGDEDVEGDRTISEGSPASAKRRRDRIIVLLLGIALLAGGLGLVLWGVAEAIMLVGALQARAPTVTTWSACFSLPLLGTALGAFGALVLVGAGDNARADRWAMTLFGTGLLAALLGLVVALSGAVLNGLLMEAAGYRQCGSDIGYRTSVAIWELGGARCAPEAA